MAKHKYSLIVPSKHIIDEQLAYWCGFILADGCIYRNGKRSAMLRINIHKRDRGHIVKMLSWLNSDYPIHDGTRQNVQLCISSNELVALFEEYGITERKSLTAQPDSRLINNRHFWRGVIDGDGYVGVDKRNYLRLALYGTQSVCQGFADYITDLVTKPRLHDRGNMKSLEMVNSRARTVLHHLYKDANVALDRKQTLYRENCRAGRV